jgi:ribokinase
VTGVAAGPGVVVVGSVNRDHVCRVERLPRPGETVLGGEASVGSGGKGGNQAVAASLLGARTALVALVGDDESGRALVADLARAGVATAEVRRTDAPTGTAFVLVAGDGENSIVVAPGANDRLSAEAAGAAVQRLVTPGTVVVTQAEIPAVAVDAVVLAAARLGCRSVVNLAPYRPMREELLALCDPLVLNESEAGGLMGHEVRGVDAARRAVAELADRVRSVVVTVGADGAVVGEGGLVVHVPTEVADRSDVVDTTGAGDAFVGALAAALSAGRRLPDAAAIGVRAGSYAVGRPGAQASFPDADALGLEPLSVSPRVD